MLTKKTASVVLGGGSALGLAHIGVLRVLEQNFQITGIAGTSIGAIVGGLFAKGLSAADILEISCRNRNARVFSPLNLDMHIGGIFNGHYVRNLFYEWTDGELIENGKIPFIACTYDLISRSSIIFNKGLYSDAMRASSSLPLIFAPYKYHGLLLVDGGTQAPMPLSFCDLLPKSDVVIAVNVLPQVQHEAKLIDSIPIATQVHKKIHRTEYFIQAVFQNQSYLAVKDIIAYEPDIVIEAAMPELHPFAFHKAKTAYDYGRRIALSTLAEYKEPSFLQKIRHHYRTLYPMPSLFKNL